MSLLAIDNIVKEYRNQCVLNGVSLRIEKGERVALVGSNGAGKTTLLRIVMGIENSDSGSVTIARYMKVGYLSQDLKEMESDEETSERIVVYEKVCQLEKKLRALEEQMAVPGVDTASDAYKKLMDTYSKVLILYETMDGYTIETKIKKILLGLGLRQETLSTPLCKLSGGERMRVSVARLLLEEPDLLLLDEPTNHLDIQATEWFESFLKRFEGGILFVSHDRYFLDRVATRIAELEQGSICVRSGNYTNYMDHKTQRSQFIVSEQKRLRWTINNTNEKMQGLKSRGKTRAFKSRAKEMDRLQVELKTNLQAAKRQEHLHRANRPKMLFKQIKHISKDIARAEHLYKRFGEVTLLRDASFHIRGGERIGIIGPNGCGKTTLINMLLGNDKNYEGLLRLGEWVKYAYMGQEVLFQNDTLTIWQLIISKKDMLKREVRDYLARFQFYGDEINKSINVLSGGERVRLYLACIMLEDADCLILDEPTNHLDVSARDAVETALKDFKGTIIAVTHDRYFLTHCVEKIFELDDKKIVTFDGNYDFYKQIKYDINNEPMDGKPSTSANRSNKNTTPKKSSDSIQDGGLETKRQELEAQILHLEAQAKAMEALFDESTPPELYKEYGDLLQQVEQLYAAWEGMIS